MASTKRKRNDTKPTSNKRAKKEYPVWEAKGILAERRRDGRLEFLVDWVGVDPNTGKAWEPNWEPAEHCTDALRAEWAARSATQQASTRPSSSGSATSAATPSESPSQTQRPSRKSRVVDSSLTATPTPSVAPPIESHSRAVSGPEIPRESPQVHISKRGSPGYLYISQLPASPASSPSSLRQSLLSLQSSHAGPRKYTSSDIVYDTEEEGAEDEAASYVPSTQDPTSLEPSTQQQSSASKNLSTSSPLSEDSCSASLPISSIPETEPEPVEHDPIEDSQLHPQTQFQISSQTDDQREIPESLEIVIETSQAAPQEADEVVHAAAEKQPKTLPTQDPVRTEERSSGIAEQTTPIVRAPGTESPGGHEPIDDIPAGSSPATEPELTTNGEDSQQPLREAPLAVSPVQVAHNTQQQLIDQSSVENPSDSQFAHCTTPQIRPARQPGQSTHVHTTTPTRRDSTRRDSITSVPAQTQSGSPGSDNNIEQAVANPARDNCSAGLDVEVQSTIVSEAAPTTQVRQAVEPASGHHSRSPSQHAQQIAHETFLSTQDDVAESIRTTVEKDVAGAQDYASPQSRHDSSQESPASSPLPVPPSQSLGIVGSNHPTRLVTPHLSSSNPQRSISSHNMDELRKELDEQIAKKNRENPFQSKRVLTPSKLFPNSYSSGTRSPSAIPNRSPAPQVPTSLRTVAVSSSVIESSMGPETGTLVSAAQQEEGESGTSDNNNVPVSVEPTMPVSTDEELSDAEDGSVLNDDLQLLPQEYVVPLPIEGRQASAYEDVLGANKEDLKAFLDDPDNFEHIEKIEAVIQRLQAIETHIDLSYGASPLQGIGSSTQVEHQTKWSFDNSIKFRFVSTLLHKLREQNMHVLLVLERDDARLFNLVETCMEGRLFNYKSPTRGHQADPDKIMGKVSVTILPRNSTPLVRPPDLIVCLDGHTDAGEIRKKNWAANPDRALVPILHLVIPRTVDHIVRYTSPTLNRKRRLHTIVATLAQLRLQGDIGRAMSHTPKTGQAADEIVQFLTSEDAASPSDWPLPSIGSIKDVIEFQSQQSQENIASPPRAPTAASKRPLEDDAADPSKRMRFTPQPHDPSSSTNNDTTHISDSLPGTAPLPSKLQHQLALALAEVQRLRAREASWSKQQTAHEDRSRLYAKLQSEHTALQTSLAAAQDREATLRSRLEARTTDLRAASARTKALEDDALLSPDAQIAALARLRADLAAAQDAAARAKAAQASAEQSLAYVSEQYRDAQTAAATARAEAAALTTQIAALKPKAEGTAAELARLAYERRDTLDREKEGRLLAENRVLKVEVGRLGEEVARLRSARGVGVGTRAQTPRPGSRAASPMTGRDRVANLRGG